MDWNHALGLAIVGAIAPFFWLVVLAIPLWLGRRYLPDRIGLTIFGRYWDGRRDGFKLPAWTFPVIFTLAIGAIISNYEMPLFERIGAWMLVFAAASAALMAHYFVRWVGRLLLRRLRGQHPERRP